MDTNKYTDKVKAISYPDRPKKPIFPAKLASSEDIRKACAEDIRKYAEDIRKYADEIEAYQPVFQEWMKKVAEYNEKVAEVEAEFKAALFEELGVVGNKKAELFYSIARARTHSGGYSEIWNEACDLVALIKIGVYA